MLRMTASGSLYAGFQVFAKQVKAKARNGIVPQWDLRGKLRLNPSRKRPNLARRDRVLGRGNGRSLILEVRNLGNTLDPVGGTVSITGPSPRNATSRRSGRARPGRPAQGRRAARHEGRQLHGHLDDHPGRQRYTHARRLPPLRQ